MSTRRVHHLVVEIVRQRGFEIVSSSPSAVDRAAAGPCHQPGHDGRASPAISGVASTITSVLRAQFGKLQPVPSPLISLDLDQPDLAPTGEFGPAA